MAYTNVFLIIGSESSQVCRPQEELLLLGQPLAGAIALTFYSVGYLAIF